MKQEVKTPALIGIVAIVVGVALFFGLRTIGNSGNLDNGQVKYTPGTPPWLEKDPSKRGVGGLGSHGASSPASTAPVASGMPEGPPVLGSGK